MKLVKPIGMLLIAGTLSGCLAASGDNTKSYVTKLTPGEERNSAITKACSFDKTALTAFAAGGLVLLLGGDAGDAAAAAGAAGLVANAISQEACNEARKTARQAMLAKNTGIKQSWSDPATKSRGYSIVTPTTTVQNVQYGKRTDVVWVNGQQISSTVRVSQSSSGRWVSS